MYLQEFRINLPKLGVSIGFVSNGCIRFLRHAGADTVVSYDDHVDAVFNDDGFSLWIIIDDQREDKLDYEYNVQYDYKTMPTLKAWLIAQKFELLN